MTRADTADGVISSSPTKSCGRPGARGPTAKAYEGFCLCTQECAAALATVTATTRAADSGARGALSAGSPPRSRAPVWWSLSTGGGVLATAGAAGYLRSTVGLILALAEVSTLLITALILLVVGLLVILRGSKEARDNLFRFLRWARNGPEPPVPPETSADTGHVTNAMKSGIPSAGHASGVKRAPERTHTVLPVLKEPLPYGVTTLCQWARRIDRAPSTVVTRWRRRPGFPSPIGQLPSESQRHRDASESLYIETELDVWRMTQAGLHRNKRRSMH
jgi:hypothetical protein